MRCQTRLRAVFFVLVFVLVCAAVLSACSSGDGDGGGDGVDTTTGSDVAGDDVAAGDVNVGDDGATPADVPPTGDAGSDGSGLDVAADTGGGGELTPTAWCDRWVGEYCALLAACPLPGQELRTEAECRLALGSACVGPPLEAAVAAGAVAFDGGAAAACLGDLAGLDCATFRQRLRATGVGVAATCGDVVDGLVAPGGGCALGIECAGGSFCRFGDACPGICTAYAAVGATCGGDAWCDFGESLCVGGSCQALPATEGDACDAGFCRVPLVCDTDAGVCRTPGLAGDSCGAGVGVCYPGLLCFGDEGGGGVCQPLRAEGETCFGNADCRGGTGEALICAGGTCQAAPAASEACYDFLCATDAWCDTAALPPTCVAFPDVGQACAAGNRCGPERFCDAGTCRERRGTGEPCAAHQQCADARCYGGVCRAADMPPCDL